MDRKFALAAAACLTLLCAAYANHFHGSFHFDDNHTVVSNLSIRRLGNIPQFFRSAATFSSLPSNQSYRPLVTTTLALDYAAGRLDPLPYHVDSFALFAVTCVLLALFFRRVLDLAAPAPENRWLALFGAALFGLHTANAETVNYVIARSEILSTLGIVAALELRAASAVARRFHLYLVPAALALLAKESAAMFAPLLFLYVTFVERQRTAREALRPAALEDALVETLPSLALCGGLVFLALRLAPTWVAGAVDRAGYLRAQPFVAVRALVQFALPLRLSVDTDWKPVASVFDERVVVGLAILAGLLWLGVRCARSAETRPIAFGIGWFFLASLPTALVPLAEVTNDHRLYFPFVGLCLASAAAAGLLVRRAAIAPRRAALAGLALLVAHGTGVHERNRVWRTELALWRDATEKSPGNGRAWMDYGLAQMEERDPQGARGSFQRSIALLPDYAFAHTNLAGAEAALGDRAAAEREYQEGVRLGPNLSSTHAFYGRFLLSSGRDAAALSELRRATALSPTDPMPRLLLLEVLTRQQEWDALGAEARELLRLDPADAQAARYLAAATAHAPPETFDQLLTRTVAAFRAGDFAEMLRVADQGVALQPASAVAHNNRCSALNGLRRFADAKAECARALELDPAMALARNNLAVADAGLTR